MNNTIQISEQDKLKELAKYHDEWVRMVYSLGGDSYTEDIVQEMYIKVFERNYNIYNDEGKLNKYYIYLMLRSILITYFRQKQKVKKVCIDDYTHLANSDTIDEQKAFEKLSNLVDQETSNWRWYDKMLFDIYRHEGLSMRKMSDEIGISFVSIFHTLKNCKGKIKDNLKKEYEHYKEEAQ